MSGTIGESQSKSNILNKTKDTAKAWMSWSTAGESASIKESFGFSSATWNETGKTTLNFSKAMSQDDYTISFTQITQYGYAGDAVNTTNVTTANYSHHYREQGGTARDGYFRSLVLGE